MQRERLAVVGSLVLMAATLHCTIPDLPSEGGACPCAPGYECDKQRDVCVRRGQAASVGSGSGGGVGGSGGSNTGTGGAASSVSASTGSGGVGACGGANEWQMSAMDWTGYGCNIMSPNCGLQVAHVLCCDNIPSNGYATPSYASAVGMLTSTHSWFVCWVKGEAQSNGSAIWYYTALDIGGWGWVP